jgi:hypothetical protein
MFDRFKLVYLALIALTAALVVGLMHPSSSRGGFIGIHKRESPDVFLSIPNFSNA